MKHSLSDPKTALLFWALALSLLILALIGGLIGLGWRYILARRRRQLQAPRSSPDSLSTPIASTQAGKSDGQAWLPPEKVIDVDGVQINYAQTGKGPDVVLMHGIGASLYIWRFVFPILALRYRVTALDFAGFGKSSKDVTRDYGLDAQAELTALALTRIGVNKANLVGSSMGGTIALWMARREPKRFLRVVALAPASERRLVPLPFQHLSRLTPMFHRALNQPAMRILLGRVVARPSVITDDVVAAYLAPFRDDGRAMRVFVSALGLIRDPRLPTELKAVSAKVLVVYGARDLLVPRSVIDRLMGLLPNAKLLVHGDGGHHIMEDEPAWTASTIADFLSEPS